MCERNDSNGKRQALTDIAIDKGSFEGCVFDLRGVNLEFTDAEWSQIVETINAKVDNYLDELIERMAYGITTNSDYFTRGQ